MIGPHIKNELLSFIFCEALLCLCKDGEAESGAKLDRWFSSEEFQEKKVTWANQKLQQFFIKFRVAGKLNCCDDTSV